MSRLSGKRAVITGAVGGMGQVACRLFCNEGAVVLGADLNEEAGKALESELRSEGFDFRFRAADVSKAASIEALATTAREQLGVIDVLYNNAGIIVGKPILETTEEEWDFVERVNSRSIFLATKAFVPLMTSGKGSIINVSSVGGLVAFGNMGAYGAAKAAAAHFTRVAAVEFAPGIRVNAICPGVIDTPMPRNFTKDFPNRDQIFEAWNHEHLTGRLGRPEEVVSYAIWLASDESGFMTGSVVAVDGGYSTR